MNNAFGQYFSLEWRLQSVGCVSMNLGNAIIIRLLLAAVFTMSTRAEIIPQKPAICAVFSDGTKATVEESSVGFNHEFHSEPQSVPFTSRIDELVTWFSYQNASNKYMSANLTTFIEDDHGCVFVDPGGGIGTGFGEGKMEVMAIEHPVFPRRQKEFKLVVAKMTTMGPRAIPPVTLMIPNPKVIVPMEWKPESYPIVKKFDDLQVTLKKIDTVFRAGPRFARENITLKSRQGVRLFEPEIAIEQNGQPTREWTGFSTNFSDVTGNSHGSFLCPHEPALKMTIEFARTPDARFDSNELWSPPEMAAPEAGKFQMLTGSGTIDDVTFRLATLSGPGVVIYSNSVPIKATPPDGALRPLHVTSSSISLGDSTYVLSETKSDSWVLGMFISGLKPAHDLLVFIIDDHGRKTTASGYFKQAGEIFFPYSLDTRGQQTMVSSLGAQSNAICFISMPMDKTTKTMRINFVIQKRRKIEFLFKPTEVIRNVAYESTQQSIPTVSTIPYNGKGFINGIPAKEFRHKSARDFLKSLAKDTYEGQKIASELAINGLGVEYIYPIYNEARMLATMKDNGWARDGNMDAAIKRRKDMTLRGIGGSFGMSGIPVITNKVLLDQLLELKPMKSYYNSDLKYDYFIKEPEDQWLSEKDVLIYIKEHPASFCWMPVSLNIPENLSLGTSKYNSNENKLAIVSQNSGPGLILGMPAKKIRHITVEYFMRSLAKDTYEGQKIASELVKNGIGIEFIPFIYFDAKHLGEMARSAEMQPTIIDLLNYKRTTFMAEYCSSVGRKGLPPFPNRELLELLLSLRPKKDYEPDDIKIITSVT
jgi:hypothetical protein